MDKNLVGSDLSNDSSGLSLELTPDNLRSILNGILDRLVSFVSIIGPDGRLLEINEAVATTTGVPKEQLVGTKVWDSPALAFSSEAPKRLKAAFENSLQGKPVRYMEQFKDASGSIGWVDINLVPNIENGRVNYVIGSGIDVTELVQQAHELRQTEREFQMLAESIPQKVWVTDAEGRANFFNSRWHDYIGDSKKSFALGWLETLHPEDQAGTTVAWQDAVKNGGTYDVEYRLRRHDGEYRWHLARGVPYKDESGITKKWFGTSTDIHDQKLTEEALKKMSEGLEQIVDARTAELLEMNKELEAFSYSVSHDLRTPLRSIEGFSQAVLEDEKDKLGQRALKDLHRVVDAAQFMGRLIDDLLKLSRLSRREMSKESVSLSVLADSIISRMKQADPNRKISVTVESTPNVIGDPGLLELALENLLSNAWKFTSKVEKPKIEFGSTMVNGQLAFFVRDNGVGFNMSFYNKLFGAFQRLHRASDFHGTGIGLATVRRIINRHGGKVWAEAELDKGATFFFSIKNVDKVSETK